jgi:hypothetical protein
MDTTSEFELTTIIADSTVAESLKSGILESRPLPVALPILPQYCDTHDDFIALVDESTFSASCDEIAFATCFPAEGTDIVPLVAHNVDVFDLNTNTRLGIAVANQIARDDASYGPVAVAVECFPVPQYCEYVDEYSLGLKLDDEEARILMELFDKSMSDISEKDHLNYKSDKSIHDKAVRPMHFASSSNNFIFDNTPSSFAITAGYKPSMGACSKISSGRWNEKRKRSDMGDNPTAKQLATAKRARTNGQFSKCKIKWVSVSAVEDCSETQEAKSDCGAFTKVSGGWG